MDDTALIAKQQREIEDLRERVGTAVDALNDAHIRMVGVGGPLNDDRLGCNKDQRREFWTINQHVELALHSLTERDRWT